MPTPAGPQSHPAQPGLRYIALSTLRACRKAASKFASFPASARQTFRAVYATLTHLASLLDAAGVRMLAGSDSGGAAWEVPGLALHQEFDELARAGQPPLRILQMTTWDAAEFLDAIDVMGTHSALRLASSPGPALSSYDMVAAFMPFHQSMNAAFMLYGPAAALDHRSRERARSAGTPRTTGQARLLPTYDQLRLVGMATCGVSGSRRTAVRRQ